MKEILKRFSAVSVLTVICMLSVMYPVYAAKDEKVYMQMKSNGEIYKSYVGGKETEKANGEKEELPIETKIKYFLDGEEKSYEEIKGKSGKVKIEINFENKDKHMVNVDGKVQEMYTPYLVAAGLMVEDDNFSNIKVSSGKALGNGIDTVIVGIALPGLADSLGISKDKIDIPTSIVIEADCKKFEMGNMYMFVESNIFDTDSFDFLNDFENMFSDIEKLKDASTQLVTGTQKLNEGAHELKDGVILLSDTLKEKIAVYKDYEEKLRNREALQNKIIEIVNEKLDELMPEIKAQSIDEAKAVVLNHKEELEEAVVDTSMKYTKQAIDSKIAEIEANNWQILSAEQEAELKEAITNDVKEVLAELEQDPSFKAIEGSVKQTVVDKVKEITKAKTKTVVSEQIQAVSQIGIDSLLTDTDKAAIGSKAQPIIQAMVPTLMAQGMSQEQAIAAATAQVNELTKTSAGIAIGKVSDMSDTIAEATVDSIVVDVDTMLDNEELVNQEIENLKTSISGNIAKTLKINDAAVMQSVQNNMKAKIVASLKQKLAQDETILKYAEGIKSEVGSSVDEIAIVTAEDVAEQYTVTLSNEVVQNVIRKSLNSETVDNKLAAAIEQYEDEIYGKMDEIDTAIVALEDGLNKLEGGVTELANGTETLAEGMSEFDNEGIDKLYKLINGDLKSYKNKAKKLTNLSNKDKAYKYVIKVDSI